MHDSLGSWGVDSEAWVTKHDQTAHDIGSGSEGGPADMG